MPRARQRNAQFLEWLKELRDEHEEGDHRRQIYGKAFNGLKTATKEYTTPRELLEVKGIGPKIVAILERRHASENGGASQQPPATSKPRGRPVKRSATEVDVEPPPRAKRRAATAAELPIQEPPPPAAVAPVAHGPFQFWYLDVDGKRVNNRSEAETSWEEVTQLLKMKVVYPSTQTDHPLAAELFGHKVHGDDVIAEMREDTAEHFPQCPGFTDRPPAPAKSLNLRDTLDQEKASSSRSTKSVDPSRQLPFYLQRAPNAVASGSRKNSDMRLAEAARSYESLSEASRVSSAASVTHPRPPAPPRPLVRAATTAIASSSSISSAPQRTASAPSILPARPRLSHAIPGLPAVERPSLYMPQTTFPPFTAETFKAGQYSIRLLLDTRERVGGKREDYSQALRERGVDVDVRTLELGDVAWVAVSDLTGAECMLDVILERKRLDDLVSSVKNSRFHEQKFRLHQSAISRVFYLVEEYDTLRHKEEWGPMINTALSSTQVVDGFLVKETKSINDTISFLAGLHAELCDLHQHKDLHVIPTAMIKRHSYVDLQRYLRREKLGQCFVTSWTDYKALNHKSQFTTVRDTWARMLLCVKGMSPEKVGAVIERWGTPRELWEAFLDAQFLEDEARAKEAAEEESVARGPGKGKGRKKKSTVPEARLMLQGVGGAEGGVRAIGQALSTKLYELFIALEYDD